MPVITPAKLAALQAKPKNIRNICILAHVDHGKTSLSDSLIAANGIISPRSAGKVRYLDSRPDEQTRGITMVSSAISLLYSILRRSSPEAPVVTEDYLVNLIDSPGHVDFSSEVSTASRLCDGALVLVDAIEGVCSQTVAVLRQSWMEQIKPILVINKVDRLITEYRMTPFEAYVRLSQILETVNAVMGSFFQGERMENDLKWRQVMEERLASRKQASEGPRGCTTTIDAHDASTEVLDSELFEEKNDEELYFGPERNNVMFASAIDGWAFTVRQFAGIYERKLGMKKEKLEKVLWGDHYFDPKTKRILAQKHLKGRNLKPMFCQLILENIWAVYKATGVAPESHRDDDKIEKISKALSITLPSHISRSRDPRTLLTAMFSGWLPLSSAVLVSIIEYLPSPFVSQRNRMPKLIDDSPGGAHVANAIREALIDPALHPDGPSVAFVSKVIAVSEQDLPQSRPQMATLSPEERQERARLKRAEAAKLQASNPGTALESVAGEDASPFSNLSLEKNPPSFSTVVKQERDHLIGFARLFSGRISVGDEVFAIPPKFNPSQQPAQPLSKITVKHLYLLMGRSFESLDSVPAGSIFGIEGVEGHIFKSGTLCSTEKAAINLAGVAMGSRPILRVALEPRNPSGLDDMIRGLKLLEQSDPCAVYEVLDNGEHAILTAGELHLERCLKDLQERFAGVEIDVGDPIVPYRETIAKPEEPVSPARTRDTLGRVSESNAAAGIEFRIRVLPLPSGISELLENSSAAIRKLSAEAQKEKRNEQAQDLDEHGASSVDYSVPNIEGDDAVSNIQSTEQLQASLAMLFEEAKEESQFWDRAEQRIVSFGPRHVGPNMLIDDSENSLFRSVFSQPSNPSGSFHGSGTQLADRVLQAFQSATFRGPLCAEPIQGIAVVIEHLAPRSHTKDGARAAQQDDLDTHQVSEILKIVQQSIHRGFLEWSPRIMLAMYSCEISSSTEVLGRVYSVITRRRGRILSEEMREGTPFFIIEALIPVIESFGFSEEIRKKTSGAAAPQLVFWGYDIVKEDPFWLPATEEELEDLGEKADRENVAKKYVDRVRARKGMAVKGKMVIEHGEKQKTLKR